MDDREAAHERVRMKTTPQTREDMRSVYCEPPWNREHPEVAALLDDFAAMEAELAALRRVEAEGFAAERNPCRVDDRRWRVVDEDQHFGFGFTLAEALEHYDARRGQGHG